MDLRFVEGNWEHGKFKLQYLKMTAGGTWVDVPCVKEPHAEWCEHMKFHPDEFGRSFWSFDSSGGKNPDMNRWNADLYQFKFCPVCGAVKP